METQPSAPSNSGATPLQFDKAEFTEAQNACSVCQKPIRLYYTVNGNIVCRSCRDQVVAAANQGTGASRFLRALAAGLAAGIAGSLLYFAIGKLTGYEFGLIAVLVGLAVGAAVRWGCYGRGGWRYQALAMALTYLAIVGTYIPDVIQGLTEAGEAEEASSETTGTPLVELPPVEKASVAEAPAEAEAETPAEDEGFSIVGLMIALVVVVVIACIAPFLAGLQNIIGLIIIGIGLWEAWKINKKPELTITGPHRLEPVSPPAAP